MSKRAARRRRGKKRPPPAAVPAIRATPDWKPGVRVPTYDPLLGLLASAPALIGAARRLARTPAEGPPRTPAPERD